MFNLLEIFVHLGMPYTVSHNNIIRITLQTPKYLKQVNL